MTFKVHNSKFHLTNSPYRALALSKYLQHTCFESHFQLQHKNFQFGQLKLVGHLSVLDSLTHPVSDIHLVRCPLQAD